MFLLWSPAGPRVPHIIYVRVVGLTTPDFGCFGVGCGWHLWGHDVLSSAYLDDPSALGSSLLPSNILTYLMLRSFRSFLRAAIFFGIFSRFFWDFFPVFWGLMVLIGICSVLQLSSLICMVLLLWLDGWLDGWMDGWLVGSLVGAVSFVLLLALMIYVCLCANSFERRFFSPQCWYESGCIASK